ncbi:MAG: flagellar basal body P-ring formation chaperone FlgA [Pseudomonadota bacterium]
MLLLLLALFATPAAAAELQAPATAQPLQAIVTNRIVYPGETLGVADLRVVTVRNTSPVHKPVVRELSQAVGRVTTRTLLPRRYIPNAVLKRAAVVQSGQTVKAVYQSGTLAITLRAVALAPAAAGERVAMRSLSGNTTIHGTAIADGTVLVAKP